MEDGINAIIVVSGRPFYFSFSLAHGFYTPGTLSFLSDLFFFPHSSFLQPPQRRNRTRPSRPCPSLPTPCTRWKTPLRAAPRDGASRAGLWNGHRDLGIRFWGGEARVRGDWRGSFANSAELGLSERKDLKKHNRMVRMTSNDVGWDRSNLRSMICQTKTGPGKRYFSALCAQPHFTE